mgnify:CR=1 FL=1
MRPWISEKPHFHCRLMGYKRFFTFNYTVLFFNLARPIFLANTLLTEQFCWQFVNPIDGNMRAYATIILVYPVALIGKSRNGRQIDKVKTDLVFTLLLHIHVLEH